MLNVLAGGKNSQIRRSESWNRRHLRTQNKKSVENPHRFCPLGKHTRVRHDIDIDGGDLHPRLGQAREISAVDCHSRAEFHGPCHAGSWQPHCCGQSFPSDASAFHGLRSEDDRRDAELQARWAKKIQPAKHLLVSSLKIFRFTNYEIIEFKRCNTEC